MFAGLELGNQFVAQHSHGVAVDIQHFLYVLEGQLVEMSQNVDPYIIDQYRDVEASELLHDVVVESLFVAVDAEIALNVPGLAAGLPRQLQADGLELVDRPADLHDIEPPPRKLKANSLPNSISAARDHHPRAPSISGRQIHARHGQAQQEPQAGEGLAG